MKKLLLQEKMLVNKIFPMPKIKGFLKKFTFFADFYINFIKNFNKIYPMKVTN